MLTFFDKAKNFLKEYWLLVAGFLGAVFYFLFRKNSEDPSLSAGVRASGKQLSGATDAARDKEKEEAEKEKARHEQAMQVINKKYEELKGNLDEEEKKEYQRIITQKGKNPKALAEEFAQLTGAKIILPED